MELATRMTESAWLTCMDSVLMLEDLGCGVSDRQLRLFACGCCRRIWHIIREANWRQYVKIAERAADGLVSRELLAQVRGNSKFILLPYRTAARATGDADARVAAYQASFYAMAAVGIATLRRRGRKVADQDRGLIVETARAAEREGQAGLLRDIIGNPFRAPSMDVRWRTWQGGLLVKLAQTIYDERAFDRLPILADALEDAGCDNVDLLTHCRSGQEHMRGCWVIDLLLGRS
jgi:hypothetical protein